MGIFIIPHEYELNFFTFSVQMPGTLSEGAVLHVSVLEKKNNNEEYVQTADRGSLAEFSEKNKTELGASNNNTSTFLCDFFSCDVPRQKTVHLKKKQHWVRLRVSCPVCRMAMRTLCAGR